MNEGQQSSLQTKVLDFLSHRENFILFDVASLDHYFDVLSNISKILRKHNWQFVIDEKGSVILHFNNLHMKTILIKIWYAQEI